MAGGYRFLAVLITVIGLTLAQSPEELVPDVNPSPDAPAPSDGIPDLQSNMPEPLLPDMPEPAADEGPGQEYPEMAPELGESEMEYELENPEMPPAPENPEIPPYESEPMLQDPSMSPAEPEGIPEESASMFEDPSQGPEIPEGIPEEEEQPIPVGSPDMPVPPPESIPDEEPVNQGPPNIPENPIPAQPAAPDMATKWPSPDLFGVPPPFGIPGPFGMESPFAAQADMPDQQFLPDPFGLPGPFGAPINPLGLQSVSGVPGFPDLPNLPGFNTATTTDKSQESAGGTSSLPFDAPQTAQPSFQQIPGLFPSLFPSVQNISSLFPQPEFPPVSAMNIDGNLQQIPDNFPSLLSDPANVNFENGVFNLPGQFPNLGPVIPANINFQHSVYHVPGQVPNLAPVSGVFPSFLPPQSQMDLGQIFPDMSGLFPGLTTPSSSGNDAPSDISSKPEGKPEQGVQDIPGFNPASPFFPALNINGNAQIPASLHFGFSPLGNLINGNINQNVTTSPAIPGFFSVPHLQMPLENPPPLPMGIGPWPFLPQEMDSLINGNINQNVTTSPAIPGFFGVPPLQMPLENPPPFPMGIGPWPFLPQGPVPKSNKTDPNNKIQYPSFTQIHTHLPSFPLGLPAPFPGNQYPLAPTVPHPLFPGVGVDPIFGGVGLPVPGVVTKPDKKNKVSPTPSLKPPQPPTPAPTPSPAAGVTPNKNGQFTDILKELLDEVKAVQKKDATKKK